MKMNHYKVTLSGEVSQKEAFKIENEEMKVASIMLFTG
jgi:hypothetical protein